MWSRFLRLACALVLCSCAAFALASSPTAAEKAKLDGLDGSLDLQLRRYGCPPEGCGQHGTCRDNRCHCDSGYAGEDCTVETSSLSSGRPASGALDQGDWAYFTFNVPPGRRWIFVVNETGTNENEDCDLYVKYSDYPTLSSFDYRDISLRENFSIEQDEGEEHPGLWVAGVYGYTQCHFLITGMVVGECELDCSGHGSCTNDACHCDSGWVGDACESSDSAIRVGGDPSTDSVDSWQWKYYHFTANTNDQILQATLSETGQASDAADLYVQFGSPPSYTSFYAANVTLGKHSTLDIPVMESDRGVVYLGVHGWNGGPYTLEVDVKASGSEECQEVKCSNHGRCTAHGSCRCNDGFSGDDCETMHNDMSLGTSYAGFVDDGEYNYYHIPVDTADTLVFSIHQTTGEGDCDVYVKAGAPPTAASFDYFDASLSNDFEVVVEEPGDATWFVSIFGFQACEYTITPSLRTSSNCGTCSNGGTCGPDGECICSEDWAGEDCSIRVHALENNVPVEGWVEHQGWRYYKFDTDPTSAVQFHLKETNSPLGGGGDLWFFVSQDVPPTLGTYDAMESSYTRDHHYSNNLGYKQAQLYYLGVYGSPLSPTQGNMTFSLVGWHPHF